jgi:hypothetical protein
MKSGSATIGIMVGRIIDEIGGREIWDRYFESIEHAFPGKKLRKAFLLIIGGFYVRGIKRKDTKRALDEMRIIAVHLNSTKIPDGAPLSETHFTSTGRNITDLLIECIQAAIDEEEDVKTVIYNGPVDTAFL